MLKNQVLKIFSWKIFDGSEKRLYLCITKQLKNNSNNKKFKHYGKRKFLP